MRQPASLLQGLEQAGILAVLRAPSAEHAVRAVDALVAGESWASRSRTAPRTLPTPSRRRRADMGTPSTWAPAPC
jgi:hypothetical protein